MTTKEKEPYTQNQPGQLDPDQLWDAIISQERQPFRTYNGLEFSYVVKGGELFISRKEKSITRSTVEIAYRKAGELGWIVSGPKKLGVFGASYLYPIFLSLGVIRKSL